MIQQRKELLTNCKKLTESAAAYKTGAVQQEALQKALIETRKSYKTLELLLEYWYPSYVEEHINGAPLFHAEANETRPDVKPPEGLQVLDELCFSEEPSASEIEILSHSLLTHMKKVLAGLEQQQLNDADVLEACRLQVIRVFTMGVTGFDTPGSLNALEEAEVSMQAVQEILKLCTETDPNQTSRALDQELQEAAQYLQEHHDFDTFDRLFFLRNSVNPIYEGLLELRLGYGLDFTSKKPSARNPASKKLFSQDFLNPYFFAQLEADEDSEALKELGKQLFYDVSLSHNQKMSCASCHAPEKGFADGMVKSASNIDGTMVDRNAPTLLNAVYADRYFYDLRAFTLEQQAEHVIFNDKEFNTAYEAILSKLNGSESYTQSFSGLFKSKNITRDQFSKALASYVLSLQSFNSTFDQYARGETNEIDEEVVRGFNLFTGKAACATCHFAPTFSGLVPPRFTKNESEILGVFKSPYTIRKEADTDMGRYGNSIVSEKAWIYERSFKTTTVRNVELTAPYFHNGAFKSLEDVVNFYDRGGAGGMGVTVKNQTLASDHLGLKQSEKEALVTFMKALTDTSSYKADLGY